MYNQGIDRVILGTAGLGGAWGAVDEEESVQTIFDALSHGIMALDTAPAYGRAEHFVGIALKQWAGVKPAISTKVGRLKGDTATQARYDYSKRGMERSLEDSLARLGVPQVDVLFLHEPAVVAPEMAEGVVCQMLRFKEQGLAKQIGLGGNLPEWFRPFFVEGQFDVLMEYNRLNACNLDATHSTIPICVQAQKEYYAASPLNMGLLGCNFRQFSQSIPDWLGSKEVEQARRVHAIAERYGMLLDVMALRFLYTIPASFKIVIGAANQYQLNSSLNAISHGALPVAIYNEILQTFNENK
ncbi:aldo/keto reductase [Sphingobacterium ginsenosidimutans]|uniref:Aldo/keto reductase n=1 Tax=Sphingobacterium ginsenosidimutans TaxID=687845 RepID=A0ABP7ZVL0_9SPHI